MDEETGRKQVMESVKKEVYSQYEIGDVTVRYLTDEEKRIGLSLVPSSCREYCEMDPLRRIDPMVQFKVAGDAYSTGHSNGRTMRNSETVRHRLRFSSQEVFHHGSLTEIQTHFSDERGLSAVHRLSGRPGEAFTIETSLTNGSNKEIILEMAESFAISDITPFCSDYAGNRLKIYRMRSEWADEGNLESYPISELKLEPRPKMFDALNARIGHRGTNACIEYVPFLAAEDTEAGVIWGGMLSFASSWQMEIYRRDNGISICGGIADAENGCWIKKLQPGETFTCPEGFACVCKGDTDDLCSRFLSLFEKRAEIIPDSEKELPIQYNEYRSTIGKPTEEKILRQAAALQGRGFTYFVIDAGWYCNDSGKWYEFSGDWKTSKDRFPEGIGHTASRLREMGFIPGLWFEPETCGIRSEAFSREELLVKKYGVPLTSGWRRFLDVRTEAGHKYLKERIIDLLKTCGFGYVKFDSNETIGSGIDGPESPGEEVRKYVRCLEDFYREVQREIPGIVIENCAAGSARAVDAFTRITSVTSFSDAFENRNNPVVAANLQRIIPAREILIWCVVDPSYDEQRMRYFLTSATLGRMCVSGDIVSLSDSQNQLLDSMVEFYAGCRDVIAKGKSRRYGPDIRSTRDPEGWQAVVRTGENGKVLVTLHTFAGAPEKICIPLPVSGLSEISSYSGQNLSTAVCGDNLVINGISDFEGAAFLFS